MLEEVKNQLLLDVKRALSITFDDADVDLRLMDLIENNAAALEMLISPDVDFITDKALKQLLLNRIRYDYNNVVDLFEDNFKHEILRYQFSKGAKNVAETDE